MNTKIVAVVFVLFLLAVVLSQVWGIAAFVDTVYFGYGQGVPYGTADTVRFEHTIPAGDNRLLVVAIGAMYSEDISAVLWGQGGSAQSLTRAVSVAGAAGYSNAEIWYLVAPTIGTDSVFIDYAGGHSGANYTATNFTGVNQSNPIGATGDSTRGDAGIEPVLYFTTSYDSSTVFTVCQQHGDVGPYTPSAGQVELWDTMPAVTSSDPYCWVGYINRLSAGEQACSLNATGNDTDDDWGIVSIEIRHIPEAAPTNITVSPDEATAAATAVNPTVDAGPVAVTPTAATAAATAVNPTVGAGPVDVITVCASGCDYTTIQGALNSASSGDTIEVQDSREYAESVNWAGDNIYLRHSVGETPSIVRRGDGGWTALMTISGDSNTVDSIKFGPQNRGNGLEISGDRNTVRNCTVDSISYESFAGGNEGEGIRIGTSSIGAKYNIISDNTVTNCAHAAIKIESEDDGLGGEADSSQFNQILDNIVEPSYGHGINLTYSATTYNLVHGNVIKMDSLSDARYQKNPMQLSGCSHNTVRKNVMCHAWARGMEISTYGAVDSVCTNNWIYNNTWYDITWRNTNLDYADNNFWIEMSAAYGSSTNRMTGNKFYNNIAAKVGQATVFGGTSPGNVYGIWSLAYFNEVSAGGDSTALVTTNDWNGNILKNNCIRIYHNVTGPHTHNAYDLTCEWAVRYMTPSGAFTFNKSVTDVNGLGSMADNFTSDPLLSDTTMTDSDWWHIPPNSPCVDAGTSLISGDINANHGGWDTLAWFGTAPDIGAYEVAAATDTCCTVNNLAFGSVYVDSTEVDSFRIYNCGDSTLIDTLAYSTWDAAYVLSTPADSAYSIATGETEWFVVEFTPVAATSYPDTNAVGDQACTGEVIFSGTGTAAVQCCTIPVILAFGYVDVATTATDSFFIANCGDITLVDSIEWNLLPVFVLASDSSYTITAGDTAWFTVEFTPVLAITYVDTLTTSQIQPECTTSYGGVIIAGLGEAPDTCCTVLDRAFGAVYIDSTKVDSFAIINCGEVALVDSIDWSVDSLFVLMSDSAYSIDVGDTAWFTVAFTPTSKGGRVAWQDVGHPACSSVMLSGRGRSLTDGGSTFIGTVIWQRAGTSSYSTLGVFGGTSYSGMAAAGCRIRDSDITDYWYTTSAKITWVSTSADSGHIRWDETGNTAWNYVEEAGDDSTMHYVLLNPPLVIDYVGYDYCVRTGSAECYSEWSEVQTYYTRCGTDDVTQLIENWDGFNNRLRVDPLYKNKAQIRYKQLTPIELPWQSTYAWIGAFDGAIKTYSFGVLDPSATWAWSYRLQDPCLSTTVWIEAPDFTTDASGHIE